MKKVFKVIGALLLLGLIAIGITYWYACTSNPWNAKRVGDISAPLGYTRVEGRCAEFMRQLPLKNHKCFSDDRYSLLFIPLPASSVSAAPKGRWGLGRGLPCTRLLGRLSRRRSMPVRGRARGLRHSGLSSPLHR